MPMGRRLSLLCCSCLPGKQRDNLSSRSLYPDQDSSGHDDYSDDDDHQHYPSHARLDSLAPSSSSLSHPYSNSFRNNNNPWPSGFSNGRFSKQSSRASQQRKPNPFRTPYRDDSDDDDVGVGEGSNNSGGHRGGGRRYRGIGITNFAPYRDDTDSDDVGAEAEAEEDRHLRREPNTGSGSGEPKDESSSSNNGNGHGGSALQNPPRIHLKMDVSPYRVFDSVSAGLPEPRLASSSSTTTTTMMRVRPAHPPRNPQGKMRWNDGDSSNNEDGEADAGEVIDVEALIAEQERITRELAAQEEALHREEEAMILSKRLAAIRAAEKRGLLRFEGDRLVLPNGENNNNSSVASTSTNTNSKDIAIPSQGRAVQEHDGDGYHRLPKERTTSSGASSFVGGVDAFNQELKMMDLDMSASRNTEKTAARPSTVTGTTSTSTSTSISTSTSTGPNVRKTISTGVSTSTSTSTSSTPTVAINPREVFNNITSFLKKVDGVIAGEGDSSDEASFSDHEQVLGKGRANYVARRPQESRVHGPEETGALESKMAVAPVEVPTVERAVTPVPFDSANREDDDDEEQPYPEDLFNSQTSDPLGDNNINSTSRPDTQASKELITPDWLVAENKETGKTKPEAVAPAPASPTSPVSPLYGHLSEAAAAVPERVFSTFTSFFNSGSSLMGLFGTGGVGAGGAGGDNDGGRGNEGVTADGRRLSSLKYGDPKKHQFSYQDHHNNSSTGASVVTGKVAEDDDNSSIDDYDF